MPQQHRSHSGRRQTKRTANKATPGSKEGPRGGTGTDNATHAKGTLPTTGIPYVIVSGTVVVKDSEVIKGVTPGQPIRFEPAESPATALCSEN